MTKALKYIVMLSIVALIVAASGCSGTNKNNVPTPVTPTPVTPTPEPVVPVTPTPTTPAMPEPAPIMTPEETPAIPAIPSSPEENITPVIQPSDVTIIPSNSDENTNLTIKPSNTTPVTGVHISTSQRNLQIIRSRVSNVSTTPTDSTETISIKSTVTNTTMPVPTNSTKESKDPFVRAGLTQNTAVAPETRKLTIIPSNKTVSSGNTTVNLGTAQRNALKILAAQKNKTGNVTTTTTTRTMTVTVGDDGNISVSNNTGNITVDTKK